MAITTARGALPATLERTDARAATVGRCYRFSQWRVRQIYAPSQVPGGYIPAADAD